LTGFTTNFLPVRLRFPVGIVKGRKTTKIIDPTTMEHKATGLTKRRSAATSSGEGSDCSVAQRGVADMDIRSIIPAKTQTNFFMNIIVFPR
jgi:hypothetical protein